MTGVLDSLQGLATSLVGRSWLLDSLLELALEDPLVKAGPILAAFLFAWHLKGEADAEQRRRRTLVVTLAALVLIAPVAKILSEQSVLPRPYVQNAQVYLLDEESLRPMALRHDQSAQTGRMAARIRDLREGRIEGNDMVSFPSDHAALFAALAFGIFLASRGAGIVALGWTFVVTLGSRVAAGLHSPLDIIAGAGSGIAILALLHLAVGRIGLRPLDRAVAWTRRHEAAAAALLLLCLIEVAIVMQTLQRAREIASATAGNLL